MGSTPWSTPTFARSLNNGWRPQERLEKIRTDLLPIMPMMAVAEVLTMGAAKYSDRNWELGIEWSRCYGAALRHLFAWWNGQDLDPETGKNHLAPALCCLNFLLEFSETHNELDDRPARTLRSRSATVGAVPKDDPPFRGPYAGPDPDF